MRDCSMVFQATFQFHVGHEPSLTLSTHEALAVTSILSKDSAGKLVVKSAALWHCLNAPKDLTSFATSHREMIQSIFFCYVTSHARTVQPSLSFSTKDKNWSRKVAIS